MEIIFWRQLFIIAALNLNVKSYIFIIIGIESHTQVLIYASTLKQSDPFGKSCRIINFERPFHIISLYIFVLIDSVSSLMNNSKCRDRWKTSYEVQMYCNKIKDVFGVDVSLDVDNPDVESTSK